MPLVPDRKPNQRDAQHYVDDYPDAPEQSAAEGGDSAVTSEDDETPYEYRRIAGPPHDCDARAQANGCPNQKPRHDRRRARQPEREEAESHDNAKRQRTSWRRSAAAGRRRLADLRRVTRDPPCLRAPSSSPLPTQDASFGQSAGSARQRKSLAQAPPEPMLRRFARTGGPLQRLCSR